MARERRLSPACAINLRGRPNSYPLDVTVRSDTTALSANSKKDPIMARRKRLSRKASRKNFSKGNRVSKKNAPRGIMRGGIRL